MLLTVIFHGSPSVIKLIRLLTLIYVFMCMISWMICPPCEITDQLAVGTQNCFLTLFYMPYTNIKTSAQNAPKCTIARQKIKFFSGEGAWPPPQTPPHWRGVYPLPRPYPSRRSAFPFIFIYDSNTALRLLVINILLSSPTINKLRHLPSTSVINLPQSGKLRVLHLAVEPFTAHDGARYLLIIQIFIYPVCI